MLPPASAQVAGGPPLPPELLVDELLEPPPLHCAAHEPLKHCTNACTSALAWHDAERLAAVTQPVHVASLAHACSELQQDAVRQPSQVGSLVVKPHPPELDPLDPLVLDPLVLDPPPLVLVPVPKPELPLPKPELLLVLDPPLLLVAPLPLLVVLPELVCALPLDEAPPLPPLPPLPPAPAP